MDKIDQSKLRERIRGELYPRLGGGWTQEQEDEAVRGVEALFSEALKEAETAGRIDELEKFDKHGLTVMSNDGSVDYVADRLESLR